MKTYTAGMIALLCTLNVACSKKEEAPKPETATQKPISTQAEVFQKKATDQIAAVQKQAEEQVDAVQETVMAKVAEYKEIAIDAARPLTDIKAEAEKMSIDQLTQTALKYKEIIVEKTSQIQPLLEQIKSISPTQLLGAEAKETKNQLTQLKETISALKAQYDIYANKLKSLGVDPEALIK
jgi:hypothetical protein